jgi:hypothetical protein
VKDDSGTRGVMVGVDHQGAIAGALRRYLGEDVVRRPLL